MANFNCHQEFAIIIYASAARSMAMAASDIPRRLEGKAAVVSASTDGLVLNNGSLTRDYISILSKSNFIESVSALHVA